MTTLENKARQNQNNNKTEKNTTKLQSILLRSLLAFNTQDIFPGAVFVCFELSAAQLWNKLYLLNSSK